MTAEVWKEIRRWLVMLINCLFLLRLIFTSEVGKHSHRNKYKMCLTALTHTKSLGLPIRLKLHNWAHDISNYHCKTSWRAVPMQNKEVLIHSDRVGFIFDYRGFTGRLSWRDWNKGLWWFSRAWSLRFHGNSQSPPLSDST